MQAILGAPRSCHSRTWEPGRLPALGGELPNLPSSTYALFGHMVVLKWGLLPARHNIALCSVQIGMSTWSAPRELPDLDMGAWELPTLGRELPCLLSSADGLPGHKAGFRCARLPWLVKLSPAPGRNFVEALAAYHACSCQACFASHRQSGLCVPSFCCQSECRSYAWYDGNECCQVHASWPRLIG